MFAVLHLLCRPLGMLIGFVYPAYASWKALEAPREASAGETSTQGRDAWLTYWVAFSTFNVVEHLLDWLVYWIPLYYVLKLLFVIWLQAPQTKGATVLLVQYITPLMRKHESAIDLALESGYKKSEMTLMEMRARGLGIFRGGSSSFSSAPADTDREE